MVAQSRSPPAPSACSSTKDIQVMRVVDRQTLRCRKLASASSTALPHVHILVCRKVVTAPTSKLMLSWGCFSSVRCAAGSMAVCGRTTLEKVVQDKNWAPVMSGGASASPSTRSGSQAGNVAVMLGWAPSTCTEQWCMCQTSLHGCHHQQAITKQGVAAL